LGLLRYGWCESFTVFALRITYSQLRAFASSEYIASLHGAIRQVLNKKFRTGAFLLELHRTVPSVAAGASLSTVETTDRLLRSCMWPLERGGWRGERAKKSLHATRATKGALTHVQMQYRLGPSPDVCVHMHDVCDHECAP
jgi:hypothetical protein